MEEGTTAGRPRLEAVDAVRGVVMALMALDHARDFFGDPNVPLDLASAPPALFWTRWVTHLCAPAFVLLAGASAYLYGARGRTRGELSWFLLTRGAWLIVLEATLVHLGWFLSYRGFLNWQVIATIGASMIVLAGAVHLPIGVTAAIGLALVAGHDALAGIDRDDWGELGWLWVLAFEQGGISLGSSWNLSVLYPVVPWLGVMLCGYALGPVLRLEPARRARVLMGTGAALVLGFVLLRLIDRYGDPNPWRSHEAPTSLVQAFLHCWKYPPSLSFLLMTLGPTLLALGALSRGSRVPLGPLVTFGRVPLFFYVAHLFVLQVGSGLFHWDELGGFTTLLGRVRAVQQGFEPHGLPTVYGAWLVALVVLYPPCRWFAGLKRRSRSAWLSYL